MSEVMYYVGTGEDRRFRLWQNTADEWCHEPLTRAAMVAYVNDTNARIEAAAPVVFCGKEMPKRFYQEGEAWVSRVEGDPAEYMIEEWWMGTYESDCLACGHDHPYGR